MNTSHSANLSIQSEGTVKPFEQLYLRAWKTKTTVLATDVHVLLLFAESCWLEFLESRQPRANRSSTAMISFPDGDLSHTSTTQKLSRSTFRDGLPKLMDTYGRLMFEKTCSNSPRQILEDKNRIKNHPARKESCGCFSEADSFKVRLFFVCRSAQLRFRPVGLRSLVAFVGSFIPLAYLRLPCVFSAAQIE